MLLCLVRVCTATLFIVRISVKNGNVSGQKLIITKAQRTQRFLSSDYAMLPYDTKALSDEGDYMFTLGNKDFNAKGVGWIIC